MHCRILDRRMLLRLLRCCICARKTEAGRKLSSRSHNMVFTQSRGFVLGASLGALCWPISPTTFPMPWKTSRASIVENQSDWLPSPSTLKLPTARPNIVENGQPKMTITHNIRCVQHDFYARAALRWRIFRPLTSFAWVTSYSNGDSGTPSLFVRAAIPWYDYP